MDEQIDLNSSDTSVFLGSNEPLVSKRASLPNIPSQTEETNNNTPIANNGRRNSTQSIFGSAQMQLQFFLKDAKEELKDFANTKTGLPPRGGVGLNGDEEKNLIGTITEKIDKEKTVRTGWKRYIGIILAISSSMFFALAILIVKSLPQYHPYSVSFWRFQGVLLPSLPIVFYCRVIKKEPIFDTILPASKPGNVKTILLLFLRGLTGSSAVVLQFYSLQFISMADSSVISFSTPVFVSLASHVLLGEKSGFVPILGGVLALFGVVVITRPPILTGGEEFDTETLIGAGLALGCMFLATATFLLLRYLRQLHFSVITAFFGIWGSVQTLLLSSTICRFQPPEGIEHWMMAVALATLTFVGQTCITLAFKYEQAGTVSLCRTCDILFAYVWQYLILGVVPDLYSMIGGIIVICGVLVVAFRKFIGDLPEDHPSRQKFWILLK